MDQSSADESLTAYGLDPADVVPIELEPGDAVMWSQWTVHGSDANLSDRPRRTWINCYGRASDCDRGTWAFRDGNPVAMDPTALIQYDDIATRPEGHYVEGAYYPVRSAEAASASSADATPTQTAGGGN